MQNEKFFIYLFVFTILYTLVTGFIAKSEPIFIEQLNYGILISLLAAILFKLKKN
ncbi:hypothetical protein J9303_17335 [Bacillaceae bacterium Marseille-Q3522]|nr:hypothetical protein [Bacillaceae bacterium Marseille-Q3522]